MVIGGDPGEVREHASRVRAWAEQVDGVAADVLGSSAVAWVSDAADQFREELEARRLEVAEIADRYRATADQLDALATALEDRQQALTQLLAAAGRTFEELAEAVANGAGEVFEVAEGFGRDLVRAGGEVLDWVGL